MAEITASTTWFHGRPPESLAFEEDRPAFFAMLREETEQFAGPNGFVIEARITFTKPIDETALLHLADDLGMEDVLDEEYDGFPGGSDHLFDSRMRRKLDELGYDAYLDYDGPIYTVIVWNPAQIEIVDHRPFRLADEASLPLGPR